MQESGGKKPPRLYIMFFFIDMKKNGHIVTTPAPAEGINSKIKVDTKTAPTSK